MSGTASPPAAATRVPCAASRCRPFGSEARTCAVTRRLSPSGRRRLVPSGCGTGLEADEGRQVALRPLRPGDGRASGRRPGSGLSVPPGAALLLGLLPLRGRLRRRGVSRVLHALPAGDQARAPVSDLGSFRGSGLAPLAEKVLAGERLSAEDGARLFRARDFLGLRRLANHVRAKRPVSRASYNVNRYLNPTNLCWVDCALCAWAKKVNEPGGYEMAIDEVVAEAGKGYSEAVTEFHIVGGLHPTWPFEYYTG